MATEGPNQHQQSAATLAAQNRSTKNGADNDPIEAKFNSWWYHPLIEAANWNKSYPYQFLIVENEDSSYRVRDEWKITLPVPPESLTVQTPFAIQTHVTLGGIIEEHNAAPVKIISITGTTGVLPLRGVSEQLRLNELGSISTSIFAGTLNGAAQTGRAAVDLASDFNPGINNFKANLVDSTHFNDRDEVGRTSGYYQFKLLEEFLENYVHMKKTDEGRKLRLAFAMWKDKHIYLVTPLTFTLERKAATPLEYQSSLQLKAWRRIYLDTKPREFSGFQPVARSPNGMAAVKNAIADARRVLAGARNTILGLVQDAQGNLFEPLRQTALFVKDHLGVALAMNDLPANIVLSSKPAVLEWASVGPTFSGFHRVLADHDAQNQQRFAELRQMASAAGKGETRAADQVGTNVSTLAAFPANTPFDKPEENEAFLSNVMVGDLRLPPATTKLIVAERERVRAFNRLDFERLRDQVAAVAATYADAVGAGSTSYDSTYNRAAVLASRQPTQQDWGVLFALNRSVMELSKLAASGTISPPGRAPSSVEFVAGLARRSGIAFRVPRSKFAVPFPYGYTLEKLANLYLGDPDRWEEIAALNGLRSPYVDEEGFDLPLLVNGSGNSIVVADSSNLVVGQQVWLSSNATSRTVRRVTRIDRRADSQSIVTVDGDGDLDRFTTIAGAVLHAFLPDTVNSQMLVYIPSDEDPADVDFETKAIPGLNQFDQLLRAGGVDLLLTPKNDLAITPDGDCRLAVGLTNIVQTIRLVLSVPRGSLLGHKDYGLNIQPGASLGDTDAATIAQQAKGLFADDPTFTGVFGVQVAVVGPATSISMAVGVRGVSKFIPITVQVLR